MKRILQIALAVAALVAAGCGGTSTTGDGAAKTASSKLVFGLVAEPANLDFTTTDGVAIPEAMLYNVYDTLVRVDSEGEIQPSLARSWDVSDDRKTYTFELQPGAKFSNGSPADAEAVKFSIERVKSGAWKISLKAGMDVVESVAVKSPTRVAVTLKRPSNDWLYRMTTRIGAIFSPDGISDLANQPIGSGPYVLDRWVRGDSIKLKANPDYWGKKPGLSEVTLKYFDDPSALNNALLSKTLDVGPIQEPDTLEQFKSGYQVIEGTTNAELTVALNNRSGPLADRRIRKAISHAIDRKAVMETASSGRGAPIGAPVAPTDPWYEDLTAVSPYDPAKAKALLKEAGKSKLSLRFRVPNLPYAVASAQAVKSQLQAVGIDAKIDVLEFPARWLELVFKNHDYDMSIIQHSEPRDIATFADPDYYWGYDSERVQKLLRRGDRGTPEQQVADTKAAAKQIADDAAAYWLYNMPYLMVAQTGLSGLPQNQVSEALDLAAIKRD